MGRAVSQKRSRVSRFWIILVIGSLVLIPVLDSP
jgi:hypothetical protein